MERVELLFVGLQDEFVEELGLGSIAGPMRCDGARKYLLRLGNWGLHGEMRGKLQHSRPEGKSLTEAQAPRALTTIKKGAAGPPRRR
jgi:hypothetical protein